MNPKIGILLVNLGTPDEPTVPSIRRYLKQFLSDPRVVEVPRFIWWCILNLFILRFRPAKIQQNYKGVWGDSDSPIREIAYSQVQKLQQLLDKTSPDTYLVSVGMTYGNPSIKQALNHFASHQIEHVLVMPLFPQYSATTTAATFDALAHAIKNIRDIPEIRFIKRYTDHPLYIAALANSVTRHWEKTGRQAKLFLSFHGIPQEYAEKGDPYPDDCKRTTLALAEKLGLKEDQYLQCFQSRVGNKPWLQPYTDNTMKELGKSGLCGLDVICPGFAADCLETLEEINEENRGYFESNGGKDFHYIPALNDSDLHIQLFADLALQNTKNWI